MILSRRTKLKPGEGLLLLLLIIIYYYVLLLLYMIFRSYKSRCSLRFQKILSVSQGTDDNDGDYGCYCRRSCLVVVF